MSRRNLTIANVSAVSDLAEYTKKYVDQLVSDYKGSGSNNETALAHDMYTRLVRHDILSCEHSYIKKEFDESKKGLDIALAGMQIDPNGVAGTTKVIYRDNGLKFSKRQNKDGPTTLLVDVLNQLARLGVDKSLVDQALRNAEKVKKGNTYYLIEADD